MGLKEYYRKRDFDKSAEPKGKEHRERKVHQFVIQKHAASRLHYDFRLEMEGVLRSWAVPKGPSLDPKDKRLAVHVEDHPIEYGTFEGIIPEGQYGGGTVLLWDRGEWIPRGDPVAAYHKGSIKFELKGEKLRGGWTLVRMPGEDGKNWLLIKERDDVARAAADYDITAKKVKSVDSGRTIEQIAKAADRVWESNREEKPEKTFKARVAAKKAASGGKVASAAKSARTKPAAKKATGVKKKSSASTPAKLKAPAKRTSRTTRGPSSQR